MDSRLHSEMLSKNASSQKRFGILLALKRTSILMIFWCWLVLQRLISWLGDFNANACRSPIIFKKDVTQKLGSLLIRFFGAATIKIDRPQRRLGRHLNAWHIVKYTRYFAVVVKWRQKEQKISKKFLKNFAKNARRRLDWMLLYRCFPNYQSF